MKRLVMLFLLGLGLVHKPAAAAVFCVSTGNALSSALETAANNNVDDEIHVRDLTLTRTNVSGIVPRWEYAASATSAHALVISGGWVDCDTQVLDPTLTVLDAEYKGSALNFELQNSTGSVSVTNLTITRGFHDGDSLGGVAKAANLGVDGAFSSITVKLNRLIVIAGKGTKSTVVGGIRVLGTDAMTVDVSNNVIAYNTSINYAGLSLSLGESTVTVNNNSIFSNTASTNSGTGVGLSLSNPLGSSYVANNVLLDNKRTSSIQPEQNLENSDGNAYLRNNHIGRTNDTAHYTIAPVINLNSTYGNPGWTIQANGVFPTPDAASPLRDSGTNTPNGGVGTLDVEGKPRIANATVDRGAIEAAPNISDRIFMNGFN